MYNTAVATTAFLAIKDSPRGTRSNPPDASEASRAFKDAVSAPESLALGRHHRSSTKSREERLKRGLFVPPGRQKKPAAPATTSPRNTRRPTTAATTMDRGY